MICSHFSPLAAPLTILKPRSRFLEYFLLKPLFSLYIINVNWISYLVSDVAQEYEAYFQSFLKLTQHLSGIDSAEKAPFKNDADKLMRPQFLIELRAEGVNLRMRLIEKSVECLAGQSQLMLLGEKGCVERIGLLSKAIQDADRSYKFDGKTFDLSEMDKSSLAVREARRLFYEEMRKAFDKK